MRVGSLALALVASVLFAIPSARAGIYTAPLSGPSSSGTGFTTVTLDTVAHTLKVDVSFSGLTGNTTAAHIHAPTAVPLTGTAGVATQTPTFVGFPLGVTSGAYSMTFDTTQASSWNAPFIAANGGTALGAEAALEDFLDSGRAYLNIHTSFVGSGEIHGFLAVPEPSSAAMLGMAALGLIARRRRAR